jgi:hypothetical protein
LNNIKRSRGNEISNFHEDSVRQNLCKYAMFKSRFLPPWKHNVFLCKRQLFNDVMTHEPQNRTPCVIQY